MADTAKRAKAKKPKSSKKDGGKSKRDKDSLTDFQNISKSVDKILSVTESPSFREECHQLLKITERNGKTVEKEVLKLLKKQPRTGTNYQ